jgi:SAM-dependent methyltransferase
MGADRAIELRALMASIHASPGATRFGEDAALYDFARPEYPADLFVWLRAKCKLDARSDCFEIGAGTGHATLPLLATPVRSLLAIEPDARLAERLREKTSDDARLAIEIARFEDARLETAMFDFGFAAMSLHWLARMKALTRVRAALKPGGYFAMWWNVYHNSAAPDPRRSTCSRAWSRIPTRRRKGLRLRWMWRRGWASCGRRASGMWSTGFSSRT